MADIHKSFGALDSIRLEEEVQFALESAKLEYNTASTIDIVFPYVFADGSTWASITGFSTVTTGKTNTNIYWLGLYYDNTAFYSPTTAPVAGNITAVWSVSNITNPVRPASGVKIGTLLRGVGDAGGDADITSFVQNGKSCFYTTAISVGLDVTTSPTDISISDEVPLTCTKFVGYNFLSNASSLTESMVSRFYSTGSNQIMEINVRSISGLATREFSVYCALPIHTAQNIRNSGTSYTPGGGVITTNNFLINGYEE